MGISARDVGNPFYDGDGIQAMTLRSGQFEIEVPEQVYQMNRPENITPGEHVFHHK
jgi:hypothetical protein